MRTLQKLHSGFLEVDDTTHVADESTILNSEGPILNNRFVSVHAGLGHWIQAKTGPVFTIIILMMIEDTSMTTTIFLMITLITIYGHNSKIYFSQTQSPLAWMSDDKDN